MKTGVKYISTVFEQKDALTTCKIEALIDLKKQIREFDTLKENPVIAKFLTKNSVSDDIFSFTAYGETRCKEGDTYDAAIGKRIAESKAQSNAFAKSTVFFDTFISLVQKVFLEDLTTCSDNAFNSYLGCYWHAKELGNAVDYIDSLETEE